MPKASSRVLQVDILRGIAILLVLLWHTPFRLASSSQNPIQMVYVAIQDIGWSGVDLFFVLSGFLVGGLLMKEIRASGKLDAKRFIIRRGFKIWPGYYVYISMMFLSIMRNEGFDSALKKMLPNLLHMQNYAKWTPCDFTWSLSVEEHFYLALPLLLLLMVKISATPKLKLPALPIVAVLLMVGCLVWRIVASSDPEYLTYKSAMTQFHADSLFFGVLLAYLHNFHHEILTKIVSHRTALFLLLGLILVSSVVFCDMLFDRTIGYSLLYLGYGAILLAAIFTPLESGWAGKIMQSIPCRLIAFLGFYSYSIYLWHISFRNIVFEYQRPLLIFVPPIIQWPVGMFIYLAGVSIVGYGAGAAIEMPMLKLRDRMFPSKAKPIVEEDFEQESVPQESECQNSKESGESTDSIPTFEPPNPSTESQDSMPKS